MYLLFDVLEQFDIEVYNIDIFFCVNILFFGLFLGCITVRRDFWLNGSVFFVLSLSAWIITSTTDFINYCLCYIFLILFHELAIPKLEEGYFHFKAFTDFVLSQFIEHTGGKLDTYYIFIVNNTIIIGVLNLLGVVPYTTALTGQLIIPLFYALKFFIVNILYGIFHHNGRFLNIFLPQEIPLFIIPILIVIEFIAFFSRVLSISIRLFANIVAGHILVKILMGFLNTLLLVHLSMGFPVLIALSGMLIIIGLELFISILQVYIFNLLLIIYINGVVDLH